MSFSKSVLFSRLIGSLTCKVRGCGRISDFCYGSGVKTKRGAKIKKIVVVSLPLYAGQGGDHMCANHYAGETFGLE